MNELTVFADMAVLAQNVVEQDPDYAANLANGMAMLGAGLAVGLAAIASGYAERGIGTAAVGAIAEDRDLFGQGLILTVLPETLVIFAIVAIFLLEPTVVTS